MIMSEQESLVDRLFDGALKLPSDQRSAFLERECPHDPTLREKVLELLDSYDRDTTEFLPELAKGVAYRETITPPTAALPGEADSANTSVGDTVGAEDGTQAQALQHDRVGNHEIIREIARGGMGVVYEATHLNLKRVVALKMVLAGKWASEAELGRFMLEAKAAAKLKHPGIVAIYDMGEFDGQPYFSMEFVPGSSLYDLIQEKPMGAREAAAYIKSISEAIEYAHQHGVLHRDLKPENVMVDPSGQTKITDFGLAKQLGEDSELTASGQIMGTPAYMAPEQALGELDRIGPHTDVYALGGILYALLIGRPPFAAKNVRDLLMQVIEQEPVSPRTINPTVPIDLDTICLKSLEKEPEKRYRSAQELADELERFLEGAPIQARPISTASRVWRWCRRKRALAGLWGSVALLLLTLLIGGPVVAFKQSELRSQAENALEREAIAKNDALNWLRQAQNSTDKWLTGVAGALKYYPVTNKTRIWLLESAAKDYGLLAREKSDDPELETERGRTHLRLGQLYVMLNDMKSANDAFAAAARLFEELKQAHPDNLDCLVESANCLANQGLVSFQMGEFADADTAYQTAIHDLEALTQRFPEHRLARESLAAALLNRGELLKETSSTPDAEIVLRRCVDSLIRLGFVSRRFPDYVPQTTSSISISLPERN